MMAGLAPNSLQTFFSKPTIVWVADACVRH